MANLGDFLRRATKLGLELLTPRTRTTRPPAPTPSPGPGRAAGPRPGPRSGSRSGNETGEGPRRAHPRSAPAADRAREIVYAPDLDGSADPGEIVWAWVPFEEDDGRGKDRPLLVVGRAGGDLLGLMLSSQDDRADDRDWVGIGSGAWDRQGRASYIRLDRVLEVGEQDIRREGSVLDRDRFDRVAAELRGRFGWH